MQMIAEISAPHVPPPKPPPETKKRDLRPEEYKTTEIGVLRRWDFTIKDTPEEEKKKKFHFLRWLLSRPATFWAKCLRLKHQLAVLIRFVGELSVVTGGKFWVLSAIRLIRSFEPATNLYLTENIIAIASSVADGKGLNQKKLLRIFAGHFILNVLSTVLFDVANSLEKVVKTKMELETKYQVLRVHCRLDDTDLQDPQIQERLRKMQKVEDVNVFEFLSTFAEFTSLSTEGVIIARGVNKSNALILALSGGLFALRYLTDPFYWEYPTTEPINDAHMRLSNLYDVGTTPSLRREVVSLNLQDFILQGFEKAREAIGDVTLDDFEPDWNRRSLFGKVIDILDDSSRMFNYVLFAITAASGNSSLVSLTQLTHLNGSIGRWLWTSHWITSRLRRLWKGLEAIEAYFDCRVMSTLKIVVDKIAMKPYVATEDPSGKGLKGMQIEFKKVSMRYPEAKKLSLTDVSFKILPGQLVACVGHNGSGKTTMISLLAQSTKLESGEILINGHKIQSYAKSDLLSRMSFTFQTSPALPFSIREFVGLGSVHQRDSDDLVKEALAAAGAEEVALTLEEGWHSYPGGVMGATLSGKYDLPKLVETREAVPRLVPRVDDFGMGGGGEGDSAEDENKEKEKVEEKEKEEEENEGKEVEEKVEKDSEEKDVEEKKEVVEEKKVDEEPTKVLDVKITDPYFMSASLRDDGNRNGEYVEFPSHAATSRILSGGQWQRIALARGLMNQNNDLLCFDEPAGNLDPAAESALFDTIVSLKGKSTILFSTHRFSVTSKADMILMFSKGKLVEQGTHSELMTIEDGEYRKMWELQAAGYQEGQGGEAKDKLKGEEKDEDALESDTKVEENGINGSGVLVEKEEEKEEVKVAEPEDVVLGDKVD